MVLEFCMIVFFLGFKRDKVGIALFIFYVFIWDGKEVEGRWYSGIFWVVGFV